MSIMYGFYFRWSFFLLLIFFDARFIETKAAHVWQAMNWWSFTNISCICCWQMLTWMFIRDKIMKHCNSIVLLQDIWYSFQCYLTDIRFLKIFTLFEAKVHFYNEFLIFECSASKDAERTFYNLNNFLAAFIISN